MATGRHYRRSLSPEALYQAIPHEPIPETVSAAKPVALEEGGSEDIAADHEPTSPPIIDSRVRWIHFMLGCAALLPWNALITATPYFLSRLEGSSLRSTFSSYLSSVCNGSSLAFLAHATATADVRKASNRVLLSTLALACLNLLLTLSTFFHLPSGPSFSFVLMNAFTQAAASAYFSTDTIGVASLFGPAAVQAVMSGQAGVAVIVSGIQLLSAMTTLWGLPREQFTITGDGKAEEKAAFLFFGLSTIFLLATTCAHVWLTRMPVYKAVVRRPSSEQDVGDASLEERQSLFSAGHSVRDSKNRIWRIAKANVVYEVAVSYVFIVTLAVFPPITTSIQPTNPNVHPLLFSAIHFFIFNIGDFTGRYACSDPRLLIWSGNKILALSISRTLFIPLFLMCNIQRSPATIPSTPLINSDLLFFLILLAFGWSNGYVSSLSMMAAPSLEHNPGLNGRKEDVDVAATVAMFCLVSGLALGSLASFGIRAMVCGCNPLIS